MAYSATIKMVTGDDLPIIRYQIKDKNTASGAQELDPRDVDTWANYSLAGAAVRVDFRKVGGKEVLESIDLLIISSSTGEVMLRLHDAEFVNIAGDYEGETVITSSSGQITVYDLMLIKIRARVKAVD